MTGPIRSERLELVWLSPELVEALLERPRGELPFSAMEGFPNKHDARFLQVRLRQMREDPAKAPWFVRAIVLRESGEMIGHIGFHGPPGVNARREARAVEIGYTVFPKHRRRGYATEAVRALLGWAREQGVEHMIASVGPENEPSLRLVRGLGFREVGRHWDDEDGEELEFELLGTKPPHPPSG